MKVNVTLNVIARRQANTAFNIHLVDSQFCQGLSSA